MRACAPTQQAGTEQVKGVKVNLSAGLKLSTGMSVTVEAAMVAVIAVVVAVHTMLISIWELSNVLPPVMVLRIVYEIVSTVAVEYNVMSLQGCVQAVFKLTGGVLSATPLIKVSLT